VRKGIAPKSEVSIMFTGPFEDSSSGRLALRVATLLLQARLSDAIREELGATYAISAESETSRNPRQEYRVAINWTCDPAKVETLVQRVFQEVDKVRNATIDTDQMGRIRDYLRRDLDRDSTENGFFLNQLVRRYENAEPVTRDVVSDERADITALTADAVMQAAVKYFDPARYIRVTLMPEGAK
jgi:zinc protease